MLRIIRAMLSNATRSSRLRALFVLREAARLGIAEANALLIADASAILDTLDEPTIRLSCAAAFLALRSTPSTALLAIEAATGLVAMKVTGHVTNGDAVPSLIPSHGWPRCIGRCAALEAVAAPPRGTTLVDDPGEVAAAWLTACSVIERLLPDELALMRDAVDLCAGLEGPHGEIRAFSNPDVPGLIVIGVRNPPILLAEQVIHESTHVRLALRVDSDETLSQMLAAMPGCASPFTRSIRSAERVLHGVVSYGQVLRLWEAFQRHPMDPLWFGDAFNHPKIIGRRLKEISERLARGWTSLVAAATPSERVVLAQVYADLVGGSPPDVGSLGSWGRGALLARLKPIPRAEVVLAAAGHKASRIGVRVHDEPLVEALLSSGISMCFGRTAQLPRKSSQLAGFANLFTDRCPLLHAGEDHEALLYLASDGEKAREVFEYDEDDAAGALFGIPFCCEAFFRRSWGRAALRGGDLFATLLEEAVPAHGQVCIAWGCNVAAMYFGAGLCWHFPCALDCHQTVATVEARRRTLEAIDPGLSTQLVAIQRRGFVWSPSHGYGLLPEGDANAAYAGEVRWSGLAPDMPAEQTVLNWIADHSAEGWRLVLPTEGGEVCP